MRLWIKWWSVVCDLRAACTRERSFLWLAATLAGLCVRPDLLGVSSIIRGLGLLGSCYDRLLDFFHSPAIDPDRLSRTWVMIVVRSFSPILRVGGRIILLADGIKVPKSGRKMPAVKLLHQESDNNTKPEYIMGHSCQAVSIVVGTPKSAFAVPLASRIHEGIVFSNGDKRTLIDKMVLLIRMLGITDPACLVADAYYACKGMARGLLTNGDHLVSRVRNNAVASVPVQPAAKGRKRSRGRPKRYGKKIRLRTFFKDTTSMSAAPSPVYGEKDVILLYRCRDLIWKPLKQVVRFVAVIHPTRGKSLFICTDLTLPPIDIIRLYGIRFKIEVSFKQALRVIGVWAYHFWMKNMKPLQRRSGNQYLHRTTEKYRNAVKRKIATYHRHIQIGLIAQGLLQYLALRCPALVWKRFGSWLRTIRPGILPSEMVVAQALRSSLPEFIASSHDSLPFTKFLINRIDFKRSEGLRLIA